MTFRDDREAAHQRAEALQEELNQKEAELARLRQQLGERRTPERRADGKRPAVALVAASALVVAGAGAVFVLRRASPEPPPVVTPPPSPLQMPPPIAMPPTPVVPVAPVAPPLSLPPPPPPGEWTPGPAVWRAEVSSASDGSLRRGTPCEIVVEADGFAAAPDPTRLTVQCGGQPLYEYAPPAADTPRSERARLALRAGQLRAGQWVHLLSFRSSPRDAAARGAVDIESERHTATIEGPAGSPRTVRLLVEDVSAPTSPGPLVPPRGGFEQTLHETVRRAARVTRIEGSAPVAAGAVCRVEVRPSWQRESECRMAVYCGERWLYGDGTSGYLTCFGSNGRPEGGDDGNPTPHGGDPMVHWRGDELVVEDIVASARWSVTLALGAAVAPIGEAPPAAHSSRPR